MYRILGVLGVVLALAASASAGPAITTGLIAYYSFDNGANLAADTSGHSYNGTVTGSVTYSAGKVGSAGYLPNTTTAGKATDYITLPGATMVADGRSPTSNFTISAWCKWEANGGSQELFSATKTAAGTPNIHVEIRPGDAPSNYRFVLRDGSAATANIVDIKASAVPPEPSVWHHVSMTYDKNADGVTAKAVNIYIDGITAYAGAATSVLDMGGWASVARIGGTADNKDGVIPDRPYSGLLDEFYLFNQTLTASQIGTLYNDACLQGDANRDGTTDATDLNTVLSFYNQSGKGWTGGDFNGDGTTDATDLNTVLSYYNQSLGGNLQAVSSAVPEPSSIAMLATLAALLSAWVIRRGRR